MRTYEPVGAQDIDDAAAEMVRLAKFHCEPIYAVFNGIHLVAHASQQPDEITTYYHAMCSHRQGFRTTDLSVSPLCIKIMIACYCSPDPAVEIGVSWNSSSGNSVREWLRSNDLIDENYRATERGKAWVRYVCATPLPEQTWILPERGGAA